MLKTICILVGLTVILPAALVSAEESTAASREQYFPADYKDVQTTPTVAVLIQKSVERLDDLMQERFALLGVFAPKPATFDIEAMSAVWEVDDPRPPARQLVDRGLLEPVGNGRFQMHALLAMHARSMFEG